MTPAQLITILATKSFPSEDTKLPSLTDISDHNFNNKSERIDIITHITTAADIKRMSDTGHYFDRNTMRYFSERMSDYYVPVYKGRAKLFLVVDCRNNEPTLVFMMNKPLGSDLFDAKTGQHYILSEEDTLIG